MASELNVKTSSHFFHERSCQCTKVRVNRYLAIARPLALAARRVIHDKNCDSAVLVVPVRAHVHVRFRIAIELEISGCRRRRAARGAGRASESELDIKLGFFVSGFLVRSRRKILPMCRR